ncbi:MAG: HAD family hydrolase [Candidatus Kaiserbacteria bacterium]|nr:MAG: HAD family hydrolase [Candidatus Kaiserbacteria bacterium]
MPSPRYVLFDFDGVIADSYDVALSTARMMCERITDSQYRSAFEGNVYERMIDVFADSHGPECKHDLDWFSVFVPAFEEKATLFSGMREVIEALHTDYRLIIVSSTLTSPIQGFMEKHGLGRYFSEMLGADVHTSKHKKIEMVFEKYKTTADRCVFVTDTLGDMKEAKLAGVGSVGVSWGFHSKETLEKGKPFRIVEAPAEIPTAIGDFYARA